MISILANSDKNHDFWF